MKNKLMGTVLLMAVAFVFSVAPGMVGLAAAKDRGATVKGGKPAATVKGDGPVKLDSIVNEAKTLGGSVQKRKDDAAKSVIDKM